MVNWEELINGMDLPPLAHEQHHHIHQDSLRVPACACGGTHWEVTKPESPFAVLNLACVSCGYQLRVLMEPPAWRDASSTSQHNGVIYEHTPSGTVYSWANDPQLGTRGVSWSSPKSPNIRKASDLTVRPDDPCD